MTAESFRLKLQDINSQIMLHEYALKMYLEAREELLQLQRQTRVERINISISYNYCNIADN